MYTIKNNTVFNDGNEIMTFDNQTDAESFVTAASLYYGIDYEETNETKIPKIITTIKEFKNYDNKNRKF